VPLLDLSDEMTKLAITILERAILPPQARIDALHIATATLHRVDYLLTWNCRHLANAAVLGRIRDLFLEMNLIQPVICTPEELLGEDDEA
jgi:hypothetical protein